ncbi:regulator [Roseovarius sp. LXJ103]|uniref:NepR family anti-sigma factor n=1 Tax=Roseovarius carneus TaxID=2853164 RepID=UPI000D612CD9|nr:NepR family anti-sigma factor [Roseovarius carneus]MBZ8118304.1 regulator [Roseovarius carneus]PWE35975.1 regulator [Pelagicola sp. LXJ1103]
MTKRQTTPSAQAQIDENLRRVFQETLEEDVPDRFTDLLAQLRAQDEGKGGKNPK